MEKATKNVSVEIESIQTGGADQSPASTVPDMLRKALAFPASVIGHATPFVAEILNYKALDLPSINNFSLMTQRENLRKLANMRSLLRDRLASADFIRLSPEKFEKPELAAINVYANKLTQIINTIDASCVSCFNDRSQCALPLLDIPDPINFPETKEITNMQNIPVGSGLAWWGNWDDVRFKQSSVPLTEKPYAQVLKARCILLMSVEKNFRTALKITDQLLLVHPSDAWGLR